MIAPPTVKTLREAGLIRGEGRGRWIDYTPVPERFQQVSASLLPEEATI